MKHSIALFGSGNWGSALAKILGRNVLQYPSLFEPQVKMWVYEEIVGNEKLSEIINTRHENIKYLPGIKLPENVKAIPNVHHVAKNSTLLIFALPHQFLEALVSDIKNDIPKHAIALSAIKGLSFQNGTPTLVTDIICQELGIDSCVLMGANIAREVAEDNFCEATLGYRNLENAQIFHKLFQTSRFRINYINEVAGVELCGAVKNVIALAAGVSDGLKLAANSKAALIRIGFQEMRKFIDLFYKVNNEIYFESCGIADVIVSCYAGRNRKIAEAYVKTKRPIQELELELLRGQKIQGIPTLGEIYQILKAKKLEEGFPLFKSLYEIFYQQLPPTKLIENITL